MIDIAPPDDISTPDPAPVLVLGKKRRIAIVGFTEHWKQAPFGQDGWHVWCMNNFHIVGGETTSGRADAWFNLHPLADSEKDTVHTEWAKTHNKVPYVTLDPFPGYPNNVVLPVSLLTAEFQTSYFTNSVSYMIAYAMHLLRPAHEEWATGRIGLDGSDLAEFDATHQPVIGIYGVDMASNSEYGPQRPSCEYFIGVARGLGYRVDIPDVSDLLKTATMYGSEAGDGAFRTRLDFRISEHKRKIAELQNARQAKANEIAQIEAMIGQFMGAVSENEYWRGAWTLGSAESTRGEKADG